MRGIRKGNEVAKLYADNKVDVIIYAVEKSLDSYKFNLLHNKQLFITQLKQNRMGSRTIDEGSMDKKGGMNYSEYVAILSGNTDLLDKARLEKKIASLEGERKAFQRSKGDSRIRLETLLANQASNSDIIARARQDMADFESRVQYDKEGKKLNPLKIDGVTSGDPKVIAAKLHEIEDKERTHVQLPVKLLVRGEVGGFRVAHQRLVFQFVLLLPVLVHVEGLFFENPVYTLHDGTQHAVHRAQYDGREEQDAQT